MVEAPNHSGEEPCVTLDAFLAQGDATAVRLEPDDDPRALAPHLTRLSLIEIAFPRFRDGRGFSAARILREAGYAGELRAQGDILPDQLAFLRRCGFDSFEPERPLNPDHVAAALNLWPHAFLAAADGAAPIWRLRHG